MQGSTSLDVRDFGSPPTREMELPPKRVSTYMLIEKMVALRNLLTCFRYSLSLIALTFKAHLDALVWT